MTVPVRWAWVDDARNWLVTGQLPHHRLLASWAVKAYHHWLGSVLTVFMEAYIMPLIKKADLDMDGVRSYRPISNLSVLSKLLERLVSRQFLDYITMAGLMPAFQSAYRQFHSTETAVLKVLADILHALDNGDVAVLMLLDLSAAFDTVDHAILLQRLETSYGIGGCALRCFMLYLSDRTQHVCRGMSVSDIIVLLCRVPQGSILGPILFLLYTADLLRLVWHHNLRPHLYADDRHTNLWLLLSYSSCPTPATSVCVH